MITGDEDGDRAKTKEGGSSQIGEGKKKKGDSQIGKDSREFINEKEGQSKMIDQFTQWARKIYPKRREVILLTLFINIAASFINVGYLISIIDINRAEKRKS